VVSKVAKETMRRMEAPLDLQTPPDREAPPEWETPPNMEALLGLIHSLNFLFLRKINRIV